MIGVVIVGALVELIIPVVRDLGGNSVNYPRVMIINILIVT